MLGGKHQAEGNNLPRHAATCSRTRAGPVEPTVTNAPTALPDAGRLDRSLGDQLDEYERLLIQRALQAANGVVAEAARRLQTDRPNLYRRMRRLGIGGGE